MNSRIKQLAEQATTYIDPTANDGVCWDFDKEKFAQLIVRECAGIFEGVYTDQQRPERIDTRIKEHFGVEE
jgi:hypothetical protein